jgi:acyl carrier protein
MARERVLKVIESVLGPELPQDSGKLELGSMKMLELVVAIEQEFGIQIPDDAPIVRIMSSVDSIVAYVEKNGIG